MNPNLTGKSPSLAAFLIVLVLLPASASANIITGGIARVVVDEVEIRVEGGIIRSTSNGTLVVHMLGLSGKILFSKSGPGRFLAFPPAPDRDRKTGDDKPALKISHSDSYKRELLPGGLMERLPEIKNFIIELYNVNPLRAKIKGAKIIRPDKKGVHKEPVTPETKVNIQVEFAAGKQHQVTISSDYPNASSFRFVVLGNSKKGMPVFKKILKKVRRLRPLFFAHCGDMVANGSGKQFQWSWALINQVRFPFFFAPGDDDIQNKGKRIFETWYGPAYYSFDFSDCHFVFVDNSSGNIGQRQLEWLINDLSKNQTKKIFVFTHMPPFDPRPALSNRMHHAANAGYFMDIMNAFGVKRVYCSHLSGYFKEERKGVTYVITGGGGAKLLKKRDYHHFVVVTVEGNKVTDRVIRIR